MTMTNEDLDAIDALRKVATPGPWRLDTKPGTHLVYTMGLPGSSASCHESEDAALIVAAVNALPTLIAEVRRLRALPVIATCGDCAHADYEEDHSEEAECVHPKRVPGARYASDRAVYPADPPPEWCPMRGVK